MLSCDPVSTFNQPDGIKVTPDGSFLAVVLPNEGPHGSVAMFSMGSDGSLTSIQPPRPFGRPSGNATGIDVTCDSGTVTVAEASGGTTLVDVFTLDPDTGLLTPVDGSPFNPPAGLNSNVPLLSVDDKFLFVSNQASNSITVLNVGPFSLNDVFSAGGTSTPAGWPLISRAVQRGAPTVNSRRFACLPTPVFATVTLDGGIIAGFRRKWASSFSPASPSIFTVTSLTASPKR